MARIRSLKPGFFIDSDLATLPPLHRLAFQGLWCHADKAGRLEDKPRELKVQILPYDSCDFAAILRDLALPKGHGPGFIQRYQVGDQRFIYITHFLDHQKPHHKEGESVLPPPPKWDTVEACQPDPGKDGAGTVLTPSQPAGFLFLGAGAGPGSLVLEEGSKASSSDGIRAMGALSVEAVAAGAVPDRRDPDNQVAPIRERRETPPIGFTVTAPDTPPELWTGDDFWRWAQVQRMKATYPPEKKPRVSLSGWWSSCLMQEGITPRALQRGFLKFGQSDHWETADPPFPFQAFMSEWSKFTRMEVPHETHAG